MAVDMCDSERRRSRSYRYVRYWHCGHTRHIRHHCFKRMRHQRRCMRDADTALTHVREAFTVTVYASDGDVTLASSVPLTDMSMDSTLSLQRLLDSDVAFHVTPHHDWFSTFSSGSFGCVHLADGSAFDIEGAEDVCLSIPSGALYTLQHVRYVPQLRQSLILVKQLTGIGCQTLLREESF
ncbi:hypothetical protein GOP47_0020199, partial [Adiantum capillus-veneris]